MSIYREYDIRGIVPQELNRESVTKIGFALAGKIEKKGSGDTNNYDIILRYMEEGLYKGEKMPRRPRVDMVGYYHIVNKRCGTACSL